MKRTLCCLLLLCLTLPFLFGFCSPLSGDARDSSRLTEAASAEDPFSPAYQAYLAYLEERSEYIQEYCWQHYGERPPEGFEALKARPIVFCDICGDETPELIYLEAPPRIWEASLNIIAYDQGELKTLFSKLWDVSVDSGVTYYLFQTQGDKALYLYACYPFGGSMKIYTNYAVLRENADGGLDPVILLHKFADYERPETTDPDDRIEYAIGEQPCSMEDYLAAEKELVDSICSILMYSFLPSDQAEDFVMANGCPDLSYEEAVSFLRGEPVEGDPGSIPFLTSAADINPYFEKKLPRNASMYATHFLTSVPDAPWSDTEKLEDMEYVGCYVLGLNRNLERPYNRLILVFRNTAAIELPEEGISEQFQYYCALLYDNVMVYSDFLNCRFFQMPEHLVSTEISGHLFQYNGYASLEEIYSDQVEPLLSAYPLDILGELPS